MFKFYQKEFMILKNGEDIKKLDFLLLEDDIKAYELRDFKKQIFDFISYYNYSQIENIKNKVDISIHEKIDNIKSIKIDISKQRKYFLNTHSKSSIN